MVVIHVKNVVHVKIVNRVSLLVIVVSVFRVKNVPLVPIVGGATNAAIVMTALNV
tara:strand:- start:400 stop:564 length:165 start_codon:yes stop_codon:yes gene_type:complete